MLRPLLLATVVLAAAFSAVAAPDAPARLVVGFDHVVGPADATWLEARGATVLRLVPNADFAVVQAERAHGFRAQVLGAEGVRYVEEDGLLQTEAEPNDLHWDLQWGPAAIHAAEAWDVEPGSDAIVYAVVDTGVDLLHPDLATAMWQNLDELPGDGVDNDGNGYVDDTLGWDCGTNDNNPHPGPGGDGHGTHVAGIAAARKDNVFGVAGVAQVKVMALKIFGGNFNSAAAECIRYGADNGARVLGMSWYTNANTAVTEALQHAWSKNVVLVKSAGNQPTVGVTYPGTLPEVIAVSSLSTPTGLSSFSSTGPKVELAAPGGSILSTLPIASASLISATPGNGYLSGTSMAQPHAAGVACLILSKNPSLTNQQVRDILASTADDIGAAGRDNQFGFGRINALAAVEAA